MFRLARQALFAVAIGSGPALAQPAAGPAPIQESGRVGDILGHPAFAAFAPLLMPWDGRDHDPDLPIRRIGTLLPYHSAVDTRTVVAALNDMIARAGQGQTIFRRFYSAAEIAADPAKANTGLFVFAGRPGAPFALIAPGGGFSYVGSLHEGFPHAAEIAARGDHAFVLRYRAGQGGTIATQDMAAALTFIHRHAAEFGLDAAGYSLWGSSAGARMVAAIGSHGAARFGGAVLPKPAAIVMAYTSHADRGETDPPTFAVVGEDDRTAPPGAMEPRIAALRRAGTDVVFRRYPDVGHGFGTGAGTSAAGWIAEAQAFWQRHRGTAQ
jgi:acetyl esterase/lipase